MSKSKRIRRNWASVMEHYEKSGHIASSRSAMRRESTRVCSTSGVVAWGVPLKRLTAASSRSPRGRGCLSGVAVATAHGLRIELERGFDDATLRRVLECVVGDGGTACLR